MRILAISEHYFPCVGGTVNYLHETLSALARQVVRVELWVPGPHPPNWLPDGLATPPYEVVWVDADYPAQGDPSRAARYAFCQAARVRAEFSWGAAAQVLRAGYTALLARHPADV